MASSMYAELVRIPCDQVQVEGMLELPPDPIGIVLFAHGSGSGRTSPRNNQVAADQVGAWPMESFYYNVLAEGAPVNITAKFFTNRKGGPLSMLSNRATRALESSKTEPTPACPVPSMITKSFSQAARSKEC